MIDWMLPAIPYLKAVHIAALALWCAGLLALPLILSQYEPGFSRDRFLTIRHYTHLTYTVGLTPAAVVAVVSGTWLIFLRDALEPWMFAKLVLVAGLVALHAWAGHVLDAVAETPGEHRAPHAALPLGLALLLMLAILSLVLAKPDLGWIAFPPWLTETQGGQLPFRVPSR